MPRFLKGTTDHDSDGRMGGSLKETDMAKTAKKQTRKAPNPIKAEDVKNVAPAQEDTDLVAMEAKSREAVGDDPLRAAKQQRAEFNRLFAEADAKSQAAITEELQVGQQVRGF
jgi:hypothetical protein